MIIQGWRTFPYHMGREKTSLTENELGWLIESYCVSTVCTANTCSCDDFIILIEHWLLGRRLQQADQLTKILCSDRRTKNINIWRWYLSLWVCKVEKQNKKFNSVVSEKKQDERKLWVWEEGGLKWMVFDLQLT